MRSRFRKIVIDHREFAWALRGNTLDGGKQRHIVIRVPRQRGLLLVDPYPWDFEITPASVTNAIHFALARGWNPKRPGAPVILGYRNGFFGVLPSGIKFTHDLIVLAAGTRPQGVLSAVSPTSKPSSGTFFKLRYRSTSSSSPPLLKSRCLVRG